MMAVLAASLEAAEACAAPSAEALGPARPGGEEPEALGWLSGRQLLHLEPPRGLLNDPNGLCWHGGFYHVFHQWNRFGLDHSYKEWGHFVSTDLIHWRHEGSAIVPDTVHDRDGVYSGSAVCVPEGIRLFYTGNVRDGEARRSFQCQALGNGSKWLKLPGAVAVPKGFTRHFRDPFVFAAPGGWWMLVGAQDEAHIGRVATFHSRDLEGWEYRGLLDDEAYENMCECPGLLRLGERGDVLISCPQRRREEPGVSEAIRGEACYELGRFDDETGRFERSAGARRLPVDEGMDFYAPQAFRAPDGRTLMFAWMCNMDAAHDQALPTRSSGYVHCLTLPREVDLEDGRLVQRPARELLGLRRSRRAGRPVRDSWVGGRAFELLFEVPGESRLGNLSLGGLSVDLRSGSVGIAYDAATGTLTLSRCSWVNDEEERCTCHVGRLGNLRVICDVSSVEVFANDGRHAMAARCFAWAGEMDVSYKGLPVGCRATYWELALPDAPSTF